MDKEIIQIAFPEKIPDTLVIRCKGFHANEKLFWSSEGTVHDL